MDMTLQQRIEEFRSEILDGRNTLLPLQRAYYQGKLDGLDWVLCELQDYQSQAETAADLAGRIPLP